MNKKHANCTKTDKMRRKILMGVYLDGYNVSAIHLLHVVCAAGKLTSLVDLPWLMKRTESAVDCRDAR